MAESSTICQIDRKYRIKALFRQENIGFNRLSFKRTLGTGLEILVLHGEISGSQSTRTLVQRLTKEAGSSFMEAVHQEVLAALISP